jgi:REP element-mobilizing transposase RayT
MCGHAVDASGTHSIHRRSNAAATARWRARKAPKGTQLGLAGLRDHGGEHGSGRRSEHSGARRKKRQRTRVAHRARPVHKSRFPVHITLRAVEGLVSFRRPRLFAALRSAIARSQRGTEFRITDFSIEPAHGHFITEATDERALSNGVRALVIRLTLAIRRITGHKSAIWADRYHAHELRSPREYRNALSYVLNNWKKHVRGASDMDPCSSAPWFFGWSDLAKGCWDGWASAQPGVTKPWTASGPEGPTRLCAREADTMPLCPVVAPKTWIAKDGWLAKSGLGTIKLGEGPADADPMRLLEHAAKVDRA